MGVTGYLQDEEMAWLFPRLRRRRRWRAAGTPDAEQSRSAFVATMVRQLPQDETTSELWKRAPQLLQER